MGLIWGNSRGRWGRARGVGTRLGLELDGKLRTELPGERTGWIRGTVGRPRTEVWEGWVDRALELGGQ